MGEMLKELAALHGVVVADIVNLPRLSAPLRALDGSSAVLHMDQVQPKIGIGRQRFAGPNAVLAQQAAWAINACEAQNDRFRQSLFQEMLRFQNRLPGFVQRLRLALFVHFASIALAVNAGAAHIKKSGRRAEAIEHVAEDRKSVV